MILDILLAIFLFIGTYIIAIYIHEWGHVFLLRKYTGNKNIKPVWNKKEGCMTITHNEELAKIDEYQYRKVLLVGILVGLLPIFLYTTFNEITLWLSIPLYFIYFWGCRSDFCTMLLLNTILLPLVL